MPVNLVLASTSIFRKKLLEKLDIPFQTTSPDIDERRRPGEAPAELVERLSLEKALAAAKNYPEHLIIGSDQVACVDDEILGKPGNFSNAKSQLSLASGKNVIFYTGLALHNSLTGKSQTLCEPFEVGFRKLTEAQIERYLKKEQPYNCAGSFKSEGYGITLFSRLSGDDPNALIGLPLIRLVELLGNEGLALP
ncbi:MAG: Maf family protein [Gammaproteobacteria bacterium]|jgi:septum formation protein